MNTPSSLTAQIAAVERSYDDVPKIKRWTTEGKPGQFTRSDDAENPYLRDAYFRRHNEQQTK